MKPVLGRSGQGLMLFDEALAYREGPGGQVRERLDGVADDGQGRSVGHPLPDPGQDVIGDLPVQRIQGLVEKDVGRTTDDGGREKRPLPLA